MFEVVEGPAGFNQGIGPALVQNDVCYFGVSGPVKGRGLWKTDGTEAGTSLLFPWAEDLGGIRPTPLGEERFAFRGGTPETGIELWSSDGTPEGTSLVLDIDPGPASSGVGLLSSFRERVVFVALTSGAGSEPWVSDGTPEGTFPMGDLVPGPDGSYPTQFTEFEDRMYFQARNSEGVPILWRWNGVAGSSPTKVLAPQLGEIPWPADLTVSGDRMYFTANQGQLLFTTTGTPSSVMEIPVNASGFEPRGPFFALGESGSVLFGAFTPADGVEPWISDGTLSGTRLFADTFPGGSTGFQFPIQGLWTVATGNFERVGAGILFASSGQASGVTLHSVPVAATGVGWVQAILSGCGTDGGLKLRAPQPAVLGSTFDLNLNGTQPSAVSQLWFSGEFDILPFGEGCNLLLSAPMLLATTQANGAGKASFPLPIPPTLHGVGIPIYFQGLAIANGGPLLGVAELSGALEVLIGS